MSLAAGLETVGPATRAGKGDFLVDGVLMPVPCRAVVESAWAETTRKGKVLQAILVVVGERLGCAERHMAMLALVTL
jgi:hypothetical protein